MDRKREIERLRNRQRVRHGQKGEMDRQRKRQRVRHG
jgi:hypothetical protein